MNLTWSKHGCLINLYNQLGMHQYVYIYGRSQWPRGLRRRFTAARLLRLWVRIPPRAWTFVCCECCVCFKVEVCATSWSLVQRSPTDCGAKTTKQLEMKISLTPRLKPETPNVFVFLYGMLYWAGFIKICRQIIISVCCRAKKGRCAWRPTCICACL